MNHVKGGKNLQFIILKKIADISSLILVMAKKVSKMVMFNNPTNFTINKFYN